jgi:hypothetical protein
MEGSMKTNNTDGLAELRGIAGRSWAKSDAERIARMQSNPHNGTLGWWRVDGVRHSAIVRASSAMEAVDRADMWVSKSWESPEARWIGTELPEVFAV